MRKAIATVSLSGRLVDKLHAVARAGFDGVEIFDNDLVACPRSPSEIAALCADLGLAVELHQPVRDVEGVAPERFPDVVRRVRAKLAVTAQLGAPVVLACSHAGVDAVDDVDLSAEQLHALGDVAAEHGVTIAYEALAWGRHVHRVGQAWEVVRRADHPAVTLAVDTFHVLARGDDGTALAGVPGDRIGFLQVADAPLMAMDLLEWSRHFRCFPGQGTLDVTGVVAATVAAGYRGPLSLEVFSDVVREADAALTARDALRSLVFLEDQVAAAVPGPAGALVAPAPPAPASVDPAFVELAGSPEVVSVLEGLGFARAGRHRTKPVTWWRHGDAHVVLNDTPGLRPTALGLATPRVETVAARAKALLWPEVDRTRGDGEALLPGITSPSGLHVLLSATPGERDDWHSDFVAVPDPAPGGWGALDHVGVAVPADRLNEEMGFFRTVLGLVPSAVEEFIEPHGRLRSRALRPAAGDLRVVLNVEDLGGDRPAREGVTQLAFGCDDVLAQVRDLRAHGVAMMAVPDNYYVDLAARFDLDASYLERLRAHGALYDRVGHGELVHAYTAVLPTGFCVELLQRRGGYDGYGSAGTHVRLAAQAG